MPKAWSAKDERQYEHIKSSQLESGKSQAGAREIAARTVNKQRRKEGRTRGGRTQGTGNPNHALEDRTVDELRNIASRMKIKGRARMRKDELIRAIRESR